MATAKKSGAAKAPVRELAADNVSRVLLNPLLLGLPDPPRSQEEASQLLQCYPSAQSKVDEFSADDEGHLRLLVPRHEHCRILIGAAELVCASYRARNLLDPGYQSRAFEATKFLREHARTRNEEARDDELRLKTPDKCGKSRHEVARGMVVCAPARCGRTRVADAIEKFFEADADGVRRFEPFIVQSNGYTGHFIRIRVVRINWPWDGKPKTLLNSFFCAINAALGPDASLEVNARYGNRESDIETAFCALGVVTNLGLLMVERINTKEATSDAAHGTWRVLGRFTRITGIPLLCFASPGALLGLMEESGSIGDLCQAGLYLITPLHEDSPDWTAFVNIVFRQCFPFAKPKKPPAWLYKALWDCSSGYHGVAVCACRAVADDMRREAMPTLDESHFRSVGRQATAIYRPHLRAVALAIAAGWAYKRASLRRYGDWLPYEVMVSAVPDLEREIPLPAPEALKAS